jgi:hypothetical protein
MSEEAAVEVTPEAQPQPLESWDAADSTPVAIEAVPTVVEEAVEVAPTEVEDAPVEEAEVAPEVEAPAEEVETQIELFKVKIDGKEEDVSIDDLKANYSGKVAYDKKFNEFDKQKKQFAVEKQEIEGYVSQFRKVAQEENMLEAAKYLGTFSGKAPHEIVNELIQALTPELERRELLTEEEMSLENMERNQKFQQEKLESDRNNFEAEQRNSALNSKINEVMTNHRISGDEWETAVKELDARLPQDQALTPELVGEFVSYNKASGRADSVLKSFDNGKHAENSEIGDALKDIIMDNPDFNDEDLLDIMKESFSEPERKQVEEKLSDKVSPGNNINDSVSEIQTPLSWDDIL